jgi:hypothetical protein
MKIAKGDVLILSGISGARKSIMGESLCSFLLNKGLETIPQNAAYGGFYYKMHPAIHNIVFFESEKIHGT